MAPCLLIEDGFALLVTSSGPVSQTLAALRCPCVGLSAARCRTCWLYLPQDPWTQGCNGPFSLMAGDIVGAVSDWALCCPRHVPYLVQEPGQRMSFGCYYTIAFRVSPEVFFPYPQFLHPHPPSGCSRAGARRGSCCCGDGWVNLVVDAVGQRAGCWLQLPPEAHSSLINGN